MSEKKYLEIEEAYLLRGDGKMPRKGIYLVEVKECMAYGTGDPSMEVIWGLQILAPTQRQATMGMVYSLTDLLFFEKLQEAFAPFGVRLSHACQVERACKRVIGKQAFVEVPAKGGVRVLQTATLRRPRKPFWERMNRYQAGTHMHLVGLGFHDVCLDYYTFPEDKEESNWAA